MPNTNTSKTLNRTDTQVSDTQVSDTQVSADTKVSRIKKLDSNVIDQIAAGEVVERPASVVKELLDNSVDAGATKVQIKIQQGGLKKIEISDNGSGISQEDLALALDSHTTSKIEKIEDIESIQTMGFRGEALSSIASVANVTISSLFTGSAGNSDGSQATKIHAYQITSIGGKTQQEEIVSREVGTTVVVEDLFFNVPARRKFLKSAQTEYRKIVDVFVPFALINPQIHFIFEADNRQVYNLPSIKGSKPGSIHPQRLSEVLKKYEFVDLFYDGEGITVGGVVAHPRYHSPRSTNQYIFVNGRPVWDNSIAKSVMLGASRFIPEGTRIPFVIAIGLPARTVDVNVHPRKVEVRFANPYRIYSAVEAAVKAAYEETLGKGDVDKEYSRFRKDGVVAQGDKIPNDGYYSKNSGSDDFYSRPKVYEVEKSLKFSKMLLEDSDHVSEPLIDSGLGPEGDMDQGDLVKPKEDEVFRAIQLLGRYIITSVGEEIWIVDQHAAAERVRFEHLLEEYQDKTVEVQNLLTSIDIELSESDLSFVKEVLEVLGGLGYVLKVKNKGVEITGVPACLFDANHEAVLQEIIREMKEYEDFLDKKGILQDKYRNSIIATMACHSSVRMNRGLSDKEAIEIVKSLLRCNNSYSCPHGRPIVWRLTKGDIDTHFERG